jgi:hypothetical protein
MTEQERFFAKVQKSDGCWEWIGARQRSNGYGRFWFRGRIRNAHRASHELFVGPIAAGLTIDHLCRNHGCVNPAHLEAVTHRENTLRGIGKTAQQVRRMSCPQGHPLSGSNLRPPALAIGKRECVLCHNAQARERRRKRRGHDALAARFGLDA